MDEAENQINDLEHKETNNNQSEQEKRIQKDKNSVSSLWDNFKSSNIRTIGVPEEKEQEIINQFEKIMKENFPNSVSYTHLTLPTIHVLCRSRWSPYH